ncbi:hypothetical protein [Amycolatopsis magusensis]|uniref:Uncharacterized protein n=1 Tax=Amycolatopsis magusensis TaxID=882444 RepID=A0ABS4PQR6_9PSEU|nr:hypothetical protein [Amycolatopsis magusensis]MBP2181771.1 hypothetical protein [Amycolatopsis magusensis]
MTILAILAAPRSGGDSSASPHLITTDIVLPLADSVRALTISARRSATASPATIPVVVPPFAKWSTDLVTELISCGVVRPAPNAVRRGAHRVGGCQA